MWHKSYRNSLTGKMGKRMLSGLAVGVFLILLLYYGSVNLLKQHLLSSGYFYYTEVERIREFQEYVDQNELAATDTKHLRKWAEERNIREFTVSRGRSLLFDVSYAGEIFPGGKEVSAFPWRAYFQVTFADGEAEVYVYEGHAEAYYRVLLCLSIAAGLAACFGIFLSGMQEDVVYIQCLEREVAAISHGNLDHAVTIQGQDELAWLACGLDQMRKTLMEREMTERELRAAQEKLVLGMAHDLRTPLTGLLAYMEILKKQEREGTVSREYIEKAYQKILQIKGLSDELFEYFLIDSHRDIQLEPPEETESALGDYLSELCAFLECGGFVVDVQALAWEPDRIRINTDYMGRILNNLISNLEKYGDRSGPVRLALRYDPQWVEFSIENEKAAPKQYADGTGIGVKNISLMMERMGGSAETESREMSYRTVLRFPVCDFT